MNEKTNNQRVETEGEKRVRAGWDYMTGLIQRVKAGEATDEELAKYQAAMDRQKRNKGILGGG